MKYLVKAIQIVSKEEKPIYVVLINPTYEKEAAEGGGNYIINLVKDYLGDDYFQYKSIPIPLKWSSIEVWKSGQLNKLAVYWGERTGWKLFTFEIPIRMNGNTPQGWAKMINRNENWKWILYEFLPD